MSAEAAEVETIHVDASPLGLLLGLANIGGWYWSRMYNNWHKRFIIA